MRKVFILVLIVFSVSITFAQSEWKKGFDKGYSEGYCYNDIGCVSPPPPASTPNINSEFNSYKDGYNQGFSEGQSRKIKDKTKQSSLTNRKRYETTKPEYIDFTSTPNINLKLLLAEQEVNVYRLKSKLNNKISEAYNRWESYIIDEEYDSMIAEKDYFAKLARISKEIHAKDIAPQLYYYTSLAYLGKYNNDTINKSNLSKASDYAFLSKSYGFNVDLFLVHDKKYICLKINKINVKILV